MQMRKQLVILTAIVLVVAGLPAFAATEATATNTVSPTLVVNVTVQKAIRLTLATGTMCTDSAGGGGDYNVNFGNVDALAINTPSCGNKFAPTTPGTTNAVYYSDYTLTPVFTSQAVSTNTIAAYVSSTFASANLGRHQRGQRHRPYSLHWRVCGPHERCWLDRRGFGDDHVHAYRAVGDG